MLNTLFENVANQFHQEASYVRAGASAYANDFNSFLNASASAFDGNTAALN